MRYKDTCHLVACSDICGGVINYFEYHGSKDGRLLLTIDNVLSYLNDH